MKQNHHFLRLVIIALLCLLLTGCGKTEKAGHTAVPASVRAAEAAPTQTPESTAEPTPTPTPVPTPEPELRILGKLYNKADTMVELAGLKDADAEGAAAVLRRMPALQLIRIGNETETPLSWESLRLLHDAAPQAVIDGLALATQILKEKRVTNEAMARLRDSLPNTDVIWRINFGAYYTARTDVTRILASMPGQAGELVHNNVENLKYCTKVKYLDVGHNNHLDTIEFIRYMPDLEVLIAALNFVEDFSPVEDCPKLEYVEAFTSRLHDLTPFANLQNLRHLNIGYNFAVTDISPLYGLKNLERLWIGEHDPVPPEQIAKFRELHPNCIVNDTTPDPTEEYWRFAEHGDEMGNQRYDPRYELLREQMGYSEEAYAYNWLDPLYPYFEYDRQVVPDPDVVDFADLFDVY